MRLPFLCLLFANVFATAVYSAEQPNILYIMSDDHAAHAIGAYGGRLAKLDPTPNIDRLAKEGVRMANCFCTNAICVPSRATMITGKYSHKNGARTLNNGITPENQTVAHLMKAAGYETAVIGKWHLKHEPAPFDYYYVLPGQGSYFNPIFRVRGPKKWPNNTVRVARYDCVHSSDAITTASLKWLKSRKQKDKPFFLMHHYKAPHDNFENAERYDWLYEDIDIPEPDSLRNRGAHGPLGAAAYGTSVSKRNTRRNMGHHMFVDQKLDDEKYTSAAYQRYLKKYLRTVRGVDDGIGEVIKHLEDTGQLENTVIIYTADQGFMLGEHDYIDKRWMYEESLRMPFIVRYPKRFKPAVSDDIVNNVDFAPTLLELAGVTDMPEDFQGRSFVANLEGNTPENWPTATYYRYWMHMAHHDNPAHYGIRTKKFKLIFYYGLPLDAAGAKDPVTKPHWELYNLEEDPHEVNNIYGESIYEQVTAELKKELLGLKEHIGDQDEKYPELMKVREQAW